jgi:hypothetical protein
MTPGPGWVRGVRAPEVKESLLANHVPLLTYAHYLRTSPGHPADHPEA